MIGQYNMHILLLIFLTMAALLGWMNGWVDSHAETWYPNNSYNTEVTFNDYR